MPDNTDRRNRTRTGTRTRTRTRTRNTPAASASEALFEVMAPAYEMLASTPRIEQESDAIAAVLLGVGAESVLDAGCAAGFHSIALAGHGFHVTGIDRSAAMIREAAARSKRERARARGGTARFDVVDLAESHSAPGAPFDALLCLGNTMASIPAGRARARVLDAFRRAIRPGGLLIVQMRDLTTVRKESLVMPTRALRRGREEWILLRRMDPVPGGVRFAIALLHRDHPGAEWATHTSEMTLTPTPAADWRAALAHAGFARIRFASDLRGTPRRRGGGPDLVIIARRG